MDGYLYHDTLGRMKFRLFHLLLEICKYRHHVVNMIRVGTWWPRIMYFELSEHTRTIPHWFHVSFLCEDPLYHGIIQIMIGFGSSKTCVLFQLRIILSIVRQRVTTGITRLVNWLGSSTVCYRRSSKGLHCLSCGAVG